VVPVLPVPLVATVLLDADGALSGAEVAVRVTALAKRLEANGAHIHVPRDSLEYAAEIGLKILSMRHMVVGQNEALTASDKERATLQFYANSIAHLVEAAREKGVAEKSAT